MYSIVLNNGKIINVKATEVEWYEKDRMIRFLNDKHIVARINMDNVVGWIDADYAESEENEDYEVTVYITDAVVNGTESEEV